MSAVLVDVTNVEGLPLVYLAAAPVAQDRLTELAGVVDLLTDETSIAPVLRVSVLGGHDHTAIGA